MATKTCEANGRQRGRVQRSVEQQAAPPLRLIGEGLTASPSKSQSDSVIPSGSEPRLESKHVCAAVESTIGQCVKHHTHICLRTLEMFMGLFYYIDVPNPNSH